MTVTALGLRHRTTTLGYVFREKPRLKNIRKELVEELGIGLADLMKIKQGQDFIV